MYIPTKKKTWRPYIIRGEVKIRILGHHQTHERVNDVSEIKQTEQFTQFQQDQQTDRKRGKKKS